MDKDRASVKTCLNLIKKQVLVWDKTCTECEAHLSSIDNGIEQIVCCEKTDFKSIALGKQFSDISDKLTLRIWENIDISIKNVQLKLDNLCKCRKIVTKSVESCCRTLDTNSDLLTWTATQPSLCDVMLWLCSIAEEMRKQHSEKQALIGLVYCKDDKNKLGVLSLKDAWKKHCDFRILLDEISEYCFNL